MITSPSVAATAQTMLIATVGGAPQPIAAAILAARPARIWFICSQESRGSIDPTEAAQPVQASSSLKQRLADKGYDLDLGRCDFLTVPDAQDLGECVRLIRERLTPVVREWVARGPSHAVIADFTGGTKCMTAALTLVARHWPCLLEYVGGDQRDKNNLGIVVDGREQIVRRRHPWTVLGYEAVDQAAVLFNQTDYGAAALILRQAKERSDGALKRALATFEQLSEAFLLWDRFDHQQAADRLDGVSKNYRDLTAFFPEPLVDSLNRDAAGWTRRLRLLGRADRPTEDLVEDLLANAERRFAEGRTDDAVARYYRATEAFGQWRLWETARVASTASIPVEALPAMVRERWLARSVGGSLRLALQDGYALLRDLGDPAGQRFTELNLDGRRSPLNARNASILAHGFRPISIKDAEALREKVLALTAISSESLIRFPRLRI